MTLAPGGVEWVVEILGCEDDYPTESGLGCVLDVRIDSSKQSQDGMQKKLSEAVTSDSKIRGQKMTTEVKEKEANGAVAEFKLTPPRKAIKTGMPTEGMWLLVGLPKAGKTTLAASIPGAVILELEKNGADRVSGWVQEVPDLSTFRAALKASLSDKNVKVIVVDTLDVLLDQIEDDVAVKYGLENMSERKEGVNGFAVWGELRQRVNNLVATLKGCGKLVILLAHLKDPKTDSEGKVVMSNAINAPGKIGSYICSQADAIGNCFKRQSGNTTQYVLSFQGGSGVIGMFGSRLSELEDKTVVLPKEDQWAAVEALFVQKETKGAKK